MRKTLMPLLVALAFATPLSAAEVADGPDVRSDPEPAVTLETLPVEEIEARPTAPEMRLDPVQLEQRAVADEAEAAQWPRQGSFWWLVGVVVVAGVILALLL